MNYLSYFTAIGSVIAFFFAAWKYLDTKKAQERNKRFDQFRLVCAWASGVTESGQRLTQIHQAVAVYQLTEFREYAAISLLIIEYWTDFASKDASAAPIFKKALVTAREHLEKIKLRSPS